MDRRVFLKKSLVAGSLILGPGFAATGCSRDLRGQLMGPVPRPAAEHRLDQDGWHILHYASLAPSGHNSQPWFVRVEKKHQWVVGSDKSRLLSVVDPDNREALLSIGAFIENLVQAANFIGYDVDVEIIGKERFDADVARIWLKPGKSKQVSIQRLKNRRTVKTGLLSKEIQAADLKVFQEATGGGLYYFPRESSHGKLMAEAAVENFRVQFENESAMAEAAKWTRLSDAETMQYRDGLTTDGMEIGGFAGWWVRNFMDKEDVTGSTWREKGVEKAMAQASEGAGWLVITSDGNRVVDLIDSGRRFQRMALIAREKNIGIHPMTQTLEEAHGQASIRENHESSMIPQFMLRVGYVENYPDPVSLRRPVDWFLIGSG